jgi:hypothetical protein
MVALALCIVRNERIGLDLAVYNEPFEPCTLRMNDLIAVVCERLSRPIECGSCRAESKEDTRMFRTNGVQGNHESSKE